MKTPCLLALALTVIGCTPNKPNPAALTLGQATDLAQQLANDKAEAMYQCRPFSNGPPAQLLQGCWIWHTRQGQGQADIEATVKLATNGADPNVSVLLLDGRSAPVPFLRR